MDKRIFQIEDARFENSEHPAVPILQKQEVLRLLHLHSSNQTDRSAIRPHDSQNKTDIPKDSTYHKTASFLFMRAKHAPFFSHTA